MKVKGGICKAKQTVIEIRMSACTIRQNPSAIFEQKPVILRGAGHVVQVAHDILKCVLKMMEED
eukprot:12913870-Prorocentrum_lima.AAC.1